MPEFRHPDWLHALRMVALCSLWTVVPAVQAAGGGSTRGEATSAEYTQAVVLIQTEQWKDAIALLKTHLKSSRNDADGHNWLAFAYRKSAQLDLAFVHYKRALALEPAHRGAHEYIGEAYLLAGQVDKAEFHLRELERICQARCEEYQDLAAALDRFRTQAPARGSSP